MVRPPILAILFLLTTIKSIERTKISIPTIPSERFFVEANGEIYLVDVGVETGVGEGLIVAIEVLAVSLSCNTCGGVVVDTSSLALATGIAAWPIKGAPKN